MYPLSSSDKATKVMIDLLGTYTEDNASQARDDAHRYVPLCRYIKSCNCTYRKNFYLCVTSLYDSIILVILIKFIYFPFEISLVGGISPIKTVL